MPQVRSEVPIVLLAFANDRADDQRYLRDLPNELRGISGALERLDAQGKIRVHALPNSTLDVILGAFTREDVAGRVVIFHFGGHADDSTLLLEDDHGRPSGVPADDLARYLGNEALVLVFLNGCATRDQIDELRERGVKAVIATLSTIKDDVASEFAKQFYQHLAVHPLGKAFDQAVAAMQMRLGESNVRAAHRDVVVEPEPAVVAGAEGEDAGGLRAPAEAEAERDRDFHPPPEADRDEALEWPWVLECDDDARQWSLVPPEEPPMSGLISAIAGVLLIGLSIAVWWGKECVPDLAHALLASLAVLGGGLLGGSLIGLIVMQRHSVRTASFGWSLHVKGAAVLTVLCGGLAFLLPRPRPVCVVEPPRPLVEDLVSIVDLPPPPEDPILITLHPKTVRIIGFDVGSAAGPTSYRMKMPGGEWVDLTPAGILVGASTTPTDLLTARDSTHAFEDDNPLSGVRPIVTEDVKPGDLESMVESNGVSLWRWDRAKETHVPCGESGMPKVEGRLWLIDALGPCG